MRSERTSGRNIHSGASLRGYVGTAPQMHTGGKVLADGVYELQAGEQVNPAGREHMADSETSFALEPKASGPNVGPANTDNSHVKTIKPIQLKARELAAAKRQSKILAI